MSKSNPINIGDIFHRWTILTQPSLKQYGKYKRSFVLCRCLCGIEKEIALTYLKNNTSKSCGCLSREISSNICKQRNTTHNLSHHSLYKIWCDMKKRCYNSNSKNYHRYGERGIKIYQKWLTFINFYNWAISHGWRNSLTIERINNNQGYSPNNCKWATRKEQGNNKSNNKLLNAFGQIKTIKQWSEDKRCKVKYTTLFMRIIKGWNADIAIITPKYSRYTTIISKKS